MSRGVAGLLPATPHPVQEVAMATGYTGDGDPRKLDKTGGTLTGPLNFGDGVAPPDVNLYRSSPGTLRTDGAYSVAGGIGVNGANPVARQVVSGSRSDGTALASLLSALASEGLITDSTTA